MEDLKLQENLEKAIQGMEDVVWGGKVLSTTQLCGYMDLPDGRKAQVQLIVQTDEDEWIAGK